jgi:hypothetical protein
MPDINAMVPPDTPGTTSAAPMAKPLATKIKDLVCESHEGMTEKEIQFMKDKKTK